MQRGHQNKSETPWWPQTMTSYENTKSQLIDNVSKNTVGTKMTKLSTEAFKKSYISTENSIIPKENIKYSSCHSFKK